MNTHTPGPWQWFQLERAGGIYLATPNRGQLIVMDFVRQGMNTAQPRFSRWEGGDRERQGGVMVPADRLVLSKHPDAKLIEAAPDLLHVVKAFMQETERFTGAGEVTLGLTRCRAIEAMAKAEVATS